MGDFKQILTSEIISITGGAIAGGLIAYFRGLIELVPGIFILLPGFLSMKGNISGALASRLSTALHVGNIKPFEKSMITTGNIIATAVLINLVGFILGVISYTVNLLLGVNNPSIILISVLAALISGIFMIPATVLTVFYVFKKKLDPDNIMGPYVTTIGDVICILSLVFALVIV